LFKEEVKIIIKMSKGTEGAAVLEPRSGRGERLGLTLENCPDDVLLRIVFPPPGEGPIGQWGAQLRAEAIRTLLSRWYSLE